jgi:hypothetical protein
MLHTEHARMSTETLLWSPNGTVSAVTYMMKFHHVMPPFWLQPWGGIAHKRTRK